MSKLQEFEKTIQNLDNETQNLKEIANAYKKVNDLFSKYEKVGEKVTENNRFLSEITLSQKEEQERVAKFLENSIEERKDFQSQFLGQIEKQTETIATSLSTVDEQVRTHQKELSQNINTSIENLSETNKKHQKDLDDNLRIKLENHKSEIKQLIESERNQIKQIFEIEFSKAVKELSEKIVSENKINIEKQNTNRNILIALSILIILSVISLYFLIK